MLCSGVLVIEIKRYCILSNLKEIYPEQYSDFMKNNNLQKFRYITFPWNMDTNYDKFIKFIIVQIGYSFFEKNHLKNRSKAAIDELIAFNNQELKNLELQLDRKSNKAYYAFFGGVVLNCVISLLFKLIDIDDPIENIIYAMAAVIFILVCLFFLGIAIVYAYHYFSTKIDDTYSHTKIKQLKLFNKFLIDKKFEVFKAKEY